mmetsp:Transcript_105964/g.309927  ORF Transcript_105964/g.309927 Transcript_105964/m.309927 type:complete len:227 (+) Transcript_105964:668-1348(+)
MDMNFFTPQSAGGASRSPDVMRPSRASRPACAASNSESRVSTSLRSSALRFMTATVREVMTAVACLLPPHWSTTLCVSSISDIFSLRDASVSPSSFSIFCSSGSSSSTACCAGCSPSSSPRLWRREGPAAPPESMLLFCSPASALSLLSSRMPSIFFADFLRASEARPCGEREVSRFASSSTSGGGSSLHSAPLGFSTTFLSACGQFSFEGDFDGGGAALRGVKSG